MENLEYIDRFFNNEMTDIEKPDFERRILEDPEFAQEVAFYISARKLASDQSAKERFKTIYASLAPVKKISYWKTAGPYAVAASLIFVVLFTWFVNNQKSDTQKLASSYIESNLQTLGVTMGDNADSIQSALKLYNDKEYPKAALAFDKIVRTQSGNALALKYAGISWLNSGDYDKALVHFKDLAAQQSLFANPGKFYQALTLMKRNATGDRDKAKTLLREVVDEKLEGSETASDWLKRL